MRVRQRVWIYRQATRRDTRRAFRAVERTHVPRGTLGSSILRLSGVSIVGGVGLMRTRIQWIGVGLAYVGTVIGAGFASGQEIWQFFGRFGELGTFGLALAGLLFWLLGAKALEHGRGGTPHFGAFLAAAYGRASPVFEGLTTLFLALGVGVAAAGGGAAVHSLIPPLSPRLGGLAMLTGIMAVALAGATAMVRVNILVVPYLAALVLWVAWAHRGRFSYPPHDTHLWWFSALLYVSYNLFTGMTALLALGPMLPTRAASWRAAALGAAMLTGLAWLEHRVLTSLTTVGPLPMLDAAAMAGGPHRILYAVSLLAAMFTTGLAEAFALMARYGRRRGQWLWGSALLIAWPFSALVATLYPILGVLSVGFWFPLLWPVRRR